MSSQDIFTHLQKRYQEGQKNSNSSTQSWNQFSCYTYPILIQGHLNKIDDNQGIKYLSLNKINEYAENFHYNAVNKPLKQLFKYPEYKAAQNAENIRKFDVARNQYDTLYKKLKSKYGENHHLSLVIKGKILLTSAELISRQEIREQARELIDQFKRKNMLDNLFITDIYDLLATAQIRSDLMVSAAQTIKEAYQIRKKLVKSPSVELAKHHIITQRSYYAMDMNLNQIELLEKAFDEIRDTKEEINENNLEILIQIIEKLNIMYSNESMDQKRRYFLKDLKEFKIQRKLDSPIFDISMLLQKEKKDKINEILDQALNICIKGNLQNTMYEVMILKRRCSEWHKQGHSQHADKLLDEVMYKCFALVGPRARMTPDIYFLKACIAFKNNDFIAARKFNFQCEKSVIHLYDGGYPDYKLWMDEINYLKNILVQVN